MERFPKYKFACPCCGKNEIDDRVLNTLDVAGRKFEEFIGSSDVYYAVTSGFRCKKHNEDIGGAPHSFHLIGWAADTIPVIEGVDDQKLLRWWFFSLVAAGFTGVGLTRGTAAAIHADLRAKDGHLPQIWAPEVYGTGRYKYLLP